MALALASVLGCGDVILAPPERKDAQELYDELWTVFHEKYAPFELRGVDWQAAHARYRPDRGADDDDLFVAVTELLAELDDGHVTLVAPGRPVFVAQRSFRENAHGLELDLGLVYARMEQGPFVSGAARYGVIEGDIGYVHVAHWGDPIPELDEVMDLLRHRRGVIVDLRHNPGGSFLNGFELVGRLADVRRLAFTTRTKTGPGPHDLGQRVEWFIEPRGAYQIATPVVVLTNGFTNSAAERTLMGLAVLPHVTVLGSPTAGNHGEKVGGEMSNGWRYSLVPQIVEDAQGRSFEGPGIPPDIRVDNAPDEVLAGRDRQLDAALALLVGEAAARLGR